MCVLVDHPTNDLLSLIAFQVESFIPLWEWDIPKKKSKKKKGDKHKDKTSDADKLKKNGGAFVEEVEESGDSRPQSRSARVEEVEDEGDPYEGFGASDEVCDNELDYHAGHREYIVSEYGESNPFIVDEADEAYLSVRPRLGDGSESDDPVVAEECMPIRTLCAWVNGVSLTECILDPGSQIVAISEGLCNHLHLVYNPANTLGMESANGIVNRSLGVVMDVPLTINGTNITLYLQMHVMRDAAYGILLGRPFDTLASTIVETSPDGVHKLTLRCPNTQRVAVVPTFNRGEGRPALPAAARPGF